MKKKANDRKLPLADTIVYYWRSGFLQKRNQRQKNTTILGMEKLKLLCGDALIAEVEFAQV